MVIQIPNIKNIYFCGDLHGNLDYIKYIVNSYHLTNSVIFICGDVGLGFSPKGEQIVIDFINKKLVNTNNFIIGVRGNHDDPLKFQDTELIKANGKNRNWLNVPDYTVVNVANKNVLCIGGGTSVDRTLRLKMGYGYWPDESVKYKEKVPEKIDIICTHSAPSFCFPSDKGEIVYEYSKIDPNLLEDITEERKILDDIYNDYKDDVKYWYYGHFHKKNFQKIGNTLFTLLDITEVSKHVDISENDNN